MKVKIILDLAHTQEMQTDTFIWRKGDNKGLQPVFFPKCVENGSIAKPWVCLTDVYLKIEII